MDVKIGKTNIVPDIRPENIDTYTETNTQEDGMEQSAEYKIVDAHPIIGGVLDKLAFFRTHASAVWYNKMKNITVLQKLDNLASNIGVLAQLATTDKTSLVDAINELNENLSKIAKLLYEKSTNIGTNTSQEVLIGSEKKYKDFSDYTFLVVTINLNNNVGFFTELLFNSGSNFQKYMFTTGGSPDYYWAAYFAIRSDGIYIKPRSYYEAHYIIGIKIYGIK